MTRSETGALYMLTGRMIVSAVALGYAIGTMLAHVRGDEEWEARTWGTTRR
ncbi:hypothetical protein [Streptomyces sp. NPDC047974]|uniref:hypothetical protein n=1 Tax=Streptomyces sp. NPDC047974 TaxID=3154343 RepID=UPI0033F1F922